MFETLTSRVILVTTNKTTRLPKVVMLFAAALALYFGANVKQDAAAVSVNRKFPNNFGVVGSKIVGCILRFGLNDPDSPVAHKRTVSFAHVLGLIGFRD